MGGKEGGSGNFVMVNEAIERTDRLSRLFLEEVRAESLMTEVGFFLELVFEGFSEVGAEPGGQFRVNDVVEEGCSIFGLAGAGSPEGMIRDEVAAGFFVGALDEIFDEFVDIS